ncbi:DUF4139 domain-containing protein [Candidatus Omnitrophota bacterium]
MNRVVTLSIICLMILPNSSFAQSVSKSTIDDQIGAEVTVYNSNLGLVKDTRKIALPAGEGELRFMDVAAYIMPVTVHAKSLKDPESFSILEQNYEYDLINSEKLLDKYVGKRIKIVDWNKYQDRKEVVEAELLSNNQGQIYKINDEIFLGHPGYKVLPEIPENLIAKPTLTWLFSNNIGKVHDIEVSYLTSNISWVADYVLVLNSDDTSSDLSGWVSLDNKSGTTYKDAKLKLVAGEIHRAPIKAFRGDYAQEKMSMAADNRFQEKSFFEYHIYDLQRPTTIKNNQTKQVSLLKASNVAIEKEFLVYGIRSYFNSMWRQQNPKQPVSVYVKFKNEKDNNLGMPLPAGTIRLYKEDEDKSLQFIGEDNIEHTPKDEEVKLKVGEAFDVVCKRKQTDYRKLSTQLFETEWEIVLRNHKKEDASIGLIEPLFGNWQVVSNSHSYEKVDAHTIRFNISVPKDGEVKVTYRVRVGI